MSAFAWGEIAGAIEMALGIISGLLLGSWLSRG